MIYKRVSKVQEEISAIGLGCWNFGGDWDGFDEQKYIEIVHVAIDAGINFFDVAPVYGWYQSEKILGKALKGKRDKVLIASKGGLLWDENRVTRNNLSKESLLKEIDESLLRLQTDYIDIYQMHWPDSNVPLAETAEALNIMRKAGKIRYVGLSNFAQKDVEEMMTYTDVACQQSLYNMLERNTSSYHGIPLEYKAEAEVLPNVKKWGQVFLPYSPLFQGLLTGRFSQANNFSKDDIRNANPKFAGDAIDKYLDAANEIKKVADEIGRPMSQLALNWLRQKPEVTSIIGGASSVDQLMKNVESCLWDMSDETMERLNQITEAFTRD
ncbi:MAG: aldo/keto reductase [Lachnospiraceae bacterium]|nr:aldo/keto reductase [Lachnospiraceae bacterium]